MSAKNAVLLSSKEQVAAGDENLPADNFSVVKSKGVDHDEDSGSIWSHLIFGLGTLVLVAPLFIPGIPMKFLMIGYVALTGVILVGCLIWNFLNGRPPRR